MDLSFAREESYDRIGEGCPICNRAHRPEVESTAGRPTRILVAEDEPAVAQLIQYNLALDGRSVEVVEDGESALRTLRQAPPSLLVLDLLLPLRSGWQVLREIRSDPDPIVRSVPVLVVSALACDRLARQLADFGAADLVGKPFSVEGLRTRVREILAESRECGAGERFTKSPRSAHRTVTTTR